MEYRSTIDQRYSSDVNCERDEARNLLELFEEADSAVEAAPELVQVYLRLKPPNMPSSLYEVRSDKCLITSVDTATGGHGRRTQHNVSKMYSFSHIFGPDANQKEIFEHVVKDNLRRLPEGHNYTLLTYGASGSGKTYTLMGTVKAPGLVPRSLEYVFKVVEAAQTPVYRPGESKANKLSSAEQEHELQWVRHLRHVSAPQRDKYRRMSNGLLSDNTKSTIDLSNRTKHYVWVSFVEIYNEAIYDLLVTTDRTEASKLQIRADPSGNVYVKGATQAFVRTGEEAYDVLVAGKHNLHVHATGVHAHSSRSHCIFTITMLTETENGVRSSYVRLCDLAGSERARRTRNTGPRMAESCAINSSLHVLERCLHALRRKQDHVPYRESKLTHLLLSGTRGEAVSMVATVNPSPEHAHETRHVLQLAAVARDIQVNNTIAESISTTTLESSCSQDTSSAEVVRLRADNERQRADIERQRADIERQRADIERQRAEIERQRADIERQRAEIERLHNELVQAQALIRKLKADMAEQQEENAVTVKELVDEARDITQQDKSQLSSLEERHEAEIAELREESAKLPEAVVAKVWTMSRALYNKIAELQEEYEAKLSEAIVGKVGTPSRALQNKLAELRDEYEAKFSEALVGKVGSPSSALQNKVMQLLTQKKEALLEGLLTAERFKEEPLHRGACIDESDEKSSDDITNQEDAIQVTDSEDDSLEPTFKKEDINRSRLLRQSMTRNIAHNTTYDNMNATNSTTCTLGCVHIQEDAIEVTDSEDESLEATNDELLTKCYCSIDPFAEDIDFDLTLCSCKQKALQKGRGRPKFY